MVRTGAHSLLTIQRSLTLQIPTDFPSTVWTQTGEFESSGAAAVTLIFYKGTPLYAIELQ